MKSLRKWFETGKICVPFAVILFLPVNLIAAAGELTVAVDPARSAETVPLNRMASERIRHDALLLTNRLPVNRLKQIRNQRLAGRSGTRRNPLDLTGSCADVPMVILPVVFPRNSNGSDPIDPSFHEFRNRAFPVRAGPFLIS